MPKRRPQREDQYHVEVINKAKVNEDGEWEYYVKWGGYSSEENSWEPAENVAGCKRLLKSFWKHIGLDNNDYYPGYQVEADEEWIEKEKEFFAEIFGERLPKKKKKKESSAAPSETKTSAGKAVSRKPRTRKPGWVYVPVLSDEEEPDTPLSKTSKKKSKSREPPTEVDSEDSDVPLRRASRTSTGVRDSSTDGKGKEREGSALLRAKQKAPSPLPTPPRATLQPKTQSNVSKQPREVDSLFSSDPSANDIEITYEPADWPAPAPQQKKNSTSVLPRLNIPTTNSVVSPVTTPKLPVAGPSKPIPSHREKQMNPRVQIMPMQVTDKSGATFISTKQKIAERAGMQKAAPVDPVNSAAATATSLFPQKSKSFANLSFKKKSSGVAATASSPTVSVQRPKEGTSSYFEGQDVVQSPTSITSWAGAASPKTGGFPPDAQSSKRTIPSIPRVSSKPQAKAMNPLAQAEQFLSSMMPEELSAPMHESAGEDSEQIPPILPPSASRRVPEINLKVGKKWKWTGELYMESSPDRADRLCNITLSEPTDHRPRGLRFSVLYDTDVSLLRLQKFHSLADLYQLLCACAPVQQCAKVSHATESDLSALSTLGAWMTRRNQFTYAHVYLDGERVGLLVLFPSAISEVCDLFKVPAYLAHQSSVLAALVPWSLTVQQYEENIWHTRPNIASAPLLYTGQVEPGLWEVIQGTKKERKLCQKSLFSQGLRLHRFTKEIYEFLNRTSRNYCVWHSPADGSVKHPGYETRALTAVLDECDAKDVGYKSDVRVIFVHVGALPTLRKLQALAMRKCKQADLRIYLYGTHPTVPPDRWGLREIYPIGGIISISPHALVENPFTVYKIISLVDKHPFWMCYIHPYVLAALVKRDYPGSDPKTLVENGEFFYSELLTLIEEGTLSVLHAPPITRAPRLSKERVDIMVDPRIGWAEWLMNLQFSEPRDILDQCVTMLPEKLSRLSGKELMQAVEKEVLADMAKMQLNPDIMDNHRRFVLLTENVNEPGAESEGTELVSPSDFNFRDDYFPVQ